MIKSISDITDAKLKGKKILVRVDFNVPVSGAKITDDFRIRKTLPLIKRLSSRGAKIILITHLESGTKTPSLAFLAKYAQKNYLPKLRFAADVGGPRSRRAVSQMRAGDILLLENLRRDPQEEKNGAAFAKRLAGLADIFVNEAFSVAHRGHASVVGIPRYLPSYAGPLFWEEVKNLKKAFRPPHPFVLILGGKKLSTKMGLLKSLTRRADKIVVGGAMANAFFLRRGMPVGKSYVEKGAAPDRKLAHSPKLLLPQDVVVLRGKTRRTTTLDAIEEKDIIYDSGPVTAKFIREAIRGAKFILWNGPFGFVEDGYINGTRDLARALADSSAETIVGGGDTVAALLHFKLLGKYSFVSTGGGAMLDFLAHGTLPGIAALVYCKKKLF